MLGFFFFLLRNDEYIQKEGENPKGRGKTNPPTQKLLTKKPSDQEESEKSIVTKEFAKTSYQKFAKSIAPPRSIELNGKPKDENKEVLSSKILLFLSNQRHRKSSNSTFPQN